MATTLPSRVDSQAMTCEQPRELSGKPFVAGHQGAPRYVFGERGNAVVVHSGARDGYQVARALAEAGMLEALVTDLWWPADRAWAARLLGLLPGSVRAKLRAQLGARYAEGLPTSKVQALAVRGMATLALDKLRRAPFAWRRGLMRHTDAALGRAAGRRAQRSGATVLSYSYYGYHAFREGRSPGMLFQLHPHPASMRRILRAELAAHPDCADSLGREWELALPEEDFERLVEETRMAAHWLVASSFTRQTLIENGTPAGAITVIPYGIDCSRFTPGPGRDRNQDGSQDTTLRLLFVGRINQRKGIKYLLEALALLHPSTGTPRVHLTVCGRVVDSLALFAACGDQVEVRPDVSAAELVEAYRAADLFVFPSVAEGFGQVLLEALACGVPILATTHTAAPDLIEDGVEGWVVEPGDAAALAARIEWAATHREELAAMRPASRARAEAFTWERFRRAVAGSFASFAAQPVHAGAALNEALDKPLGEEVRHV